MRKRPTSRSIRRLAARRVEAARRKGSVVESVEATGRTADEAIENALDELGLERDEVTIEVLAQAGQGRPARVRVTPLEGIELEYEDDDDDYEDEDDEELDEGGEEDEDDDLAEQGEEDDEDEDDEEDAPAVAVPARVPPPARRPVSRAPAGEISPEARPAADAALAVLEDLLDRMDLQSDVRVDSAQVEEGLPTVELSIHGEYGGILIG